MNMRIAGIVNDSIVDGPGLRLAIFAQGCPHHCPGCHNPESHDFAGGSDMDTEKIIARMDANPLLDGITLTGGEPFEQPGSVPHFGGRGARARAECVGLQRIHV